MNMLYDLGINLLSGLVAGAISSLAAFGWLQARDRQRARGLWRLSHPGTLAVIISTSAFTRFNGEIREGTGVGQVRALAVLSPSLIRAYGRALSTDMVMLSKRASGKHLQGDLILLGGPRTNDISERVFSLQHEFPVYMSDGPGAGGVVDSRIHWRPAGQPAIALPTTDEGTMIYGLVLRSENPLADRPGSRMWVVAGSSTAGTEVAAEWLAQNAAWFKKRWGETGVVVAVPKDVPAEDRMRKTRAYDPSSSEDHRQLCRIDGQGGRSRAE